MPTRTVTIPNPRGLHARASARFVKTAAAHDAVVTVTRGETTIDGKSIVSLLFLAAAKGSRITIRTSGREADSALAALCALVESGLGDPDNDGPPRPAGKDRKRSPDGGPVPAERGSE